MKIFLPFVVLSGSIATPSLAARGGGRSEEKMRKAIKVGKNEDPGGVPRGTDVIPCAEAKDANGQTLFKGQNKDPCRKDAQPDEVECLCCDGFSECCL